jgi:hypothetical protein
MVPDWLNASPFSRSDIDAGVVVVFRRDEETQSPAFRDFSRDFYMISTSEGAARRSDANRRLRKRLAYIGTYPCIISGSSLHNFLRPAKTSGYPERDFIGKPRSSPCEAPPALPNSQ